MFTLLGVTLLILSAFLLFSFFSLSLCLLSLCLSSLFVMFIYSLSLSLMLLLFNSFFYNLSFFIFFLKNLLFSFVHRFLWNCFVLSPLLLRLFSCCSFQSCSIEPDKLTPFFLVQKNHLFNPSRNLFAEFLPLDVLKSFIVYSLFFGPMSVWGAESMFHAIKIFFDNLNFLQQNKIPQKKRTKKNLFQDSLTLRIACAIESSLDHCCVSRLSWAGQVYVHLLVIDLGPGTFGASAHLSPFFSSLHLSPLFFQCLPLTLFVLFQLLFRLFSCCSFQSCSFEQNKLTSFFWQKNHLFNTSKNLFVEFLPFDAKKVFHRFFVLFWTHVCARCWKCVSRNKKCFW